MKIAFWSPSKSNSAVTSNLACISVMFSIMYKYKSIIIENHLQKNRINNFLSPRINHNLILENNHYHIRFTGMDSILFKLSKDKYDFEDALNNDVAIMLEKFSNTIIDDYLFHISNDNRIENEIFDIFINDHISIILEASERFADFTFIDTESSNNLSTKYILEEADLVVVNLVQKADIIFDFFKNYKSILSRSIILISNYQENSCFNLKHIIKTFNVNKSNIGVVPFNLDYNEALKYGELVSFLSNNYNCIIENKNHYFIESIINVTNLIHNKISKRLIS